MNRKGILEAASKAVHAEDRDHDYGSPEDNFANIAALWNAYLVSLGCERFEFEARDVAAMMILLKVARAANSAKADHWVDIAGYAACGGEIDDGGTEETVTMYADNMEVDTSILNSLCGIGETGPFELRFTVKKEEE